METDPQPEDVPVKAELRFAGVLLQESTLPQSRVLPHVRMVVSLIERVSIRLEQLIVFLRQAMRQQRMAKRCGGDYVLHVLNQHPP